LNFLSTLILICSLLNPLLRPAGIEGGSTVKLEDGEVNHYMGHEPVQGVNEVKSYKIHGVNLD
jgi:hypothetical protein